MSLIGHTIYGLCILNQLVIPDSKYTVLHFKKCNTQQISEGVKGKIMYVPLAWMEISEKPLL